MHNKIIFYFILYSFLGWCLESIYKSILERKPINSGFLYGPLCPMYGIGAIIMIALGSLSNNIVILFLMGFFAFSIWEYLVGLVLEKLFNTKYWDYSDIKFNIHGRICLKNSIYWGILGVLLILVIQPIVEKFTNMIPSNILLWLDIILGLAILVDIVITIFKIMIMDKKINEIFEIGDTIKEKLLELRNNDIIEKSYKENIQKLIDDLKARQNILKFKIYKRIIRLKKSFPRMHSENISKFMKQKIYIDDLKEKIKRYKRNKY